MKKTISADWIIPVTSDPVRDGAVVVENDLIADVGAEKEIEQRHGPVTERLDGHVILPGLINAHVHLDFSAVKGQIPTGLGFAEWVGNAIGKRRSLSDDEILAGIKEGVRELTETGTVAVGDITNNPLSAGILSESGIEAVIFIEETGFPDDWADEILAKMKDLAEQLSEYEGIRVSLAPHAPYSTSARLIYETGKYNRGNGTPSTIHLAESPEEVKFISKGTGFFRELLIRLGRYDNDWDCPGVSPVEYVNSLGFLTSRTLAIHLVQATAEDAELLAKRETTVVTCPRSNDMIGTGVAPIPMFLEKGLTICIATDSLASNHDLNLFNEIAFFKKQHPDVSNRTILEMVTINPANALGFLKYGSIEKGKTSRVIAVRCEKPLSDPYDVLNEPVTANQITTL